VNPDTFEISLEETPVFYGANCFMAKIADKIPVVLIVP
jgi:hypothetical protein